MTLGEWRNASHTVNQCSNTDRQKERRGINKNARESIKWKRKWIKGKRGREERRERVHVEKR